MASNKNRNESQLSIRDTEQLKAILQGSSFAIISIDSKGIVEQFNLAAEKIFGYSASDVIGKDVKVLMPGSDATHHGQYIKNYLDTGHAKIIGIGRRVIARHKSGKEFPVHLTISEIYIPGRRTFVGMLQDLTLQVEAEHEAEILRDELQHFARVSAMGEMASSLAHEINQPLTAIANFTAAARRSLEDEGQTAKERATEYLFQAGKEALRAGEIIRRLRAFIEISEAERLPQDLVFTIKEAVQLSLVGRQHQSIKLSWNLEDDLPLVFVDRIQIQQVFQNLLRNAIDAVTDQSGEKIISITISRLGSDLVLASVEDNGPGLHADVKDDLFKPFATNKTNGMGIGLSISRNIVEAHGGQIYFEQPDGNGARFCVTLNVQPPDSNVDV